MPAFLHSGGSPLLTGRYSEMFHAVDILPTLLELVSDKSPERLDGVSHWSAMRQTDWSNTRPNTRRLVTRPNTRRLVTSPREMMVYNIDDELITEIFNVRNRSGKFQVISKA